MTDSVYQFVDLVKIASFYTENPNSMLEYMLDTGVPPRPLDFRTESLISLAAERAGSSQLTAQPPSQPLGIAPNPGISDDCSIMQYKSQPPGPHSRKLCEPSCSRVLVGAG